jgi:hypothetical protein
MHCSFVGCCHCSIEFVPSGQVLTFMPNDLLALFTCCLNGPCELRYFVPCRYLDTAD